MGYFAVIVEEHLMHSFCVQASDENEAKRRVAELYEKGKIQLNRKEDFSYENYRTQVISKEEYELSDKV